MEGVVASSQITLTSTSSLATPNVYGSSYGTSSSYDVLPKTWTKSFPTSYEYVWQKTYYDSRVGEQRVKYVVDKKEEEPTEPEEPEEPEAKAIDLNEDKAITSQAVTYVAGTDNLTPPKTGWANKIPSLTDEKSLWRRAIITYEDKTNSWVYELVKPVGLNKGETLQSTNTTYGTNNNPAVIPTLSDKEPSVNKGNYLWNKVALTYADGSITNTYQVTYKETGASKGTVKKTVGDYSYSTDGDKIPTDNWNSGLPKIKANVYIWYRLVIYYDNYMSNPDYIYTAMYHKESSLGVRSVKSTYATSDTPLNTPKDSAYSDTFPDTSKINYIWTKTVTELSDNSTDTDYTLQRSSLASKSVSSASVTNSPFPPKTPSEGTWWNDTSVVPTVLKYFTDKHWQIYRYNAISMMADTITANNIISDSADLSSLRTQDLTADTANINEVILDDNTKISPTYGYRTTGNNTSVNRVNYDPLSESSSKYQTTGENYFSSQGLDTTAKLTYTEKGQATLDINDEDTILTSAYMETRVATDGSFSAIANNVKGKVAGKSTNFSNKFTVSVSPFGIYLRGASDKALSLTPDNIKANHIEGTTLKATDVTASNLTLSKQLTVSDLTTKTLKVDDVDIQGVASLEVDDDKTTFLRTTNNLYIISDKDISIQGNNISMNDLGISGSLSVDNKITAKSITLDSATAGNYVITQGGSTRGNFSANTAGDLLINNKNNKRSVKFNAATVEAKEFSTSGNFFLTGSGQLRKGDMGIYPARYNNIQGIRFAGTQSGLVIDGTNNRAYIVMGSHWNRITLGSWNTGSWNW